MTDDEVDACAGSSGNVPDACEDLFFATQKKSWGEQKQTFYVEDTITNITACDSACVRGKYDFCELYPLNFAKKTVACGLYSVTDTATASFTIDLKVLK